MKMGIVFAGGGGKGAYEVGVWKALNELGLDKNIKHVSGTSVGGLNAALFNQNDYDTAENIWKTINPDVILTRLSKGKPDKTEKGFHLFKRDGLKSIIDENIDWSKFNSNDRTCYIACKNDYGKQGMEYSEAAGGSYKNYVYGKTTYFNICCNYETEIKKKILLATSAIPIVFPGEEIDGHVYSDAGFGIINRDNTPVRPLYENDKCDVIIVVHLMSDDHFFIDKKEYPNARILEMIPGKELGGIFKGVLNFNATKAEENIQLGYIESIILFERIKDIIFWEENTIFNVQKSIEIKRKLANIMRVQEMGLTLEDTYKIGLSLEDIYNGRLSLSEPK